MKKTFLKFYIWARQVVWPCSDVFS